MMSKKHFIELADVIRQHNQIGREPFTAGQLEALADWGELTKKRR